MDLIALHCPFLRHDAARRFYHRSSAWLIRKISAFHHVNLLDFDQHKTLDLSTGWARFLQDIKLSQTIWRRSTFILFFVSVLMLRLLVILYYQYHYDFSKLKLKRMEHENSTLEMVLDIENKVRTFEGELDKLGAPYSHYTITNEFICIYALLVIIIHLVFIPILMRLTGALHFSWIRSCIDPEGSARSEAQSIAQQVVEYRESTDLFMRPRVVPRLRLKRKQLGGLSQAEGSNHRFKQAAPWAKRHETRLNEIMSRVVSCHLESFMARPEVWRSFMALSNVGFIVIAIIYGWAQIIYLYLRLDAYYQRQSGKSVQVDNFGELLTLISLVIMIMLMFLPGIFNPPIGIVEHLDELRLAENLELDVRRVVNWNARAMELLQAAIPKRSIFAPEIMPLGRFQTGDIYDFRARTCPGGMTQLINQIEINTLTLLLRYRCFCARLLRSRRSHESNIAIVFSYVMLAPVLVQLHAPYLEDAEVRMIMRDVNMVLIFPYLMFSWPTCFVHRRCLKAHASLTSLLAQLIHMELNGLIPNYINLEHEIALLRKGLEWPNEFSHRFAIRFLNIIDLTFPNLIRIQFWVALVALSMFMNLNPGGYGGSYFLSDPLGVLD